MTQHSGYMEPDGVRQGSEPRKALIPPLDDLTRTAKRTQYKLSRVLFVEKANALWRNDQWCKAQGERGSNMELQMHRARYMSISLPGASAFLLAVPSRSTRVNGTIWAVMLRRHLGLDLYEDTHRPLLCSHCGQQMDTTGLHATESCRSGWTQVHEHGAVQRTMAYDVLRPAGCATSFEEKLLIPDTRSSPADIFVPVPPPTGANDDATRRPIAYDITVRATLSGESGRILPAARTQNGSATQGEKRKWSQLNKKLQAATGSATRSFKPHWRFFPLGFDSYGAMSVTIPKEIAILMPRIAQRTHTTLGHATQLVQNAISYAIWTLAAVSIVSRQPMAGLPAREPALYITDI